MGLGGRRVAATARRMAGMGKEKVMSEDLEAAIRRLNDIHEIGTPTCLPGDFGSLEVAVRNRPIRELASPW